MGFRDRMRKKKKQGGGGLQKRHNSGTKKAGGRYPTIFLKEKVPEGIEFWKCTEGDHLVDIIPFEAGPNMPFDEKLKPISEEGDLDYVLDLFVHTNVGNMNNPYVCPYENFGLPCPICEFLKANRLEKETWKKIIAKHRVIYFLWVHNSRKDEKKGVQIFESSHYFMEQKIASIAKSPKGGGFEKFSCPDKGKSLAWTREGAGLENTQYLGHRFIDRESPIPDRILDQTFSLDSIVNMHPDYNAMKKDFVETLKKLKLGGYDDTDDGEADDVPFDDQEEDDIKDDRFKSGGGSKGYDVKKKKKKVVRKRRRRS